MLRRRLLALTGVLIACAFATAGGAAAQSASADPEAPASEILGPALADPTDAPRVEEKEDAPTQGPLPAIDESLAARAARTVLRLQAQLPQMLQGGFEDLQRGRFTPRARVTAGALLGAILLLVVLSRLLRGRGDVTVVIDYPAELRGTFCVKLASRASPSNRGVSIKGPVDAARARAHASSSSANERHQVSRETQFLRIPCRRFFVSVDGFVQTETGDVVSTHFAEQDVRPRRRESVRLLFDFQPRACPVEVRVQWDRRPVQEARIARYGMSSSLRFARGSLHLNLDHGRHRIIAGGADRVVEEEIEIDSFQPRQLVIDLADRSHLVFAGCPPAVEPYLLGDVPAAARALERDGQVKASHRLLARHHAERDQQESAAEHYEQADELAAAAEIYEALGRFMKAGELFERVGEDERAGEMYRAAGQLLKAGDSFVRADVLDAAVECFERAGDVTRWIEALAKQGEYYEAAKVALEQGERSRAIQCLNQVPVADPHFPVAVARLAEAYQAEGHIDLAIRKLEELMATRPDSDVPNEVLDQLAALLESSGEVERPLELLERLRMRDATWPGVATRIENLKKSRSRETTAPDSAAATAVAQGFDDDTFRYEIIEEVGRGGMGVVFRARDRRLGREVALKRLPENLRNHPKAVDLFLREARAAAALNHPNIVTLYDADQEGDTYYITMEFLQGQPLQRILKTQGRLQPAHVAKIGGQVAKGLEFAHEQGIVHRDIKTANLFFTDKKVVKIMDFGLAKMVEEVRRSTTVIGGTPYYMAPEQSAGEQVDHRADLYALGVTFYELLTGSVPFKQGDVAFHHRHTPAPDVRNVATDCPEALAELVAELLAKNPAQRVRSAGEVVRRLAAIAKSL